MKANIIHNASVKCKRMVRSILDVELHAFVFGIDHKFTIHPALQRINARPVLLNM